MTEETPAMDALSETDRTFVRAFLSNGFNRTKAYLKAHPGVTRQSAAELGHRKLKNSEVIEAKNELFRSQMKARFGDAW